MSRTTRMSRYQKGKTSLDFTEARDSEWQWHQLGRMQVCNSLQTDNHASTPPLNFLQAGCPSCHPTNSVTQSTEGKGWEQPRTNTSRCSVRAIVYWQCGTVCIIRLLHATAAAIDQHLPPTVVVGLLLWAHTTLLHILCGQCQNLHVKMMWCPLLRLPQYRHIFI